MARNLPFRTPGVCIDCGTSFSRDPGAWRCWPCQKTVVSLCAKGVAAVKKAVKRGDLPAVSDCICADCGKAAEHYDHRDYSKPLDVTPVCQSCNVKRGPASPAAD